jgi:thiol-disulfide isomerase/thioredoxin
MNRSSKAILFDLLAGAFLALAILALGSTTDFKITLLGIMFLFFTGGIVRGRSVLGKYWLDCILINAFFLPAGILMTIEYSRMLVFPLSALVFSYAGLVIGARWFDHSLAWRVVIVAITTQVASLGVTVGASRLLTTSGDQINMKAPTFSLFAPPGSTMIVSNSSGKITVLDFWASWCGPCRLEFPYIQQLYEKYKDNTDIKFVAINSGSGDTFDKAQAFMNSQSYSIPIAFDSGKMSDLFRVEALPTLIIIDKKGIIRLRQRGFNPTENLVESIPAQIDALLAGK